MDKETSTLATGSLSGARRMSVFAACLSAVALLMGAAPEAAAQGTPTATPQSLRAEPLFARIVEEATRLKTITVSLGAKAEPALPADYSGAVARLADLDMEGHRELARRGVDGDLKCILKGISEDLPQKLQALSESDPVQRRSAFEEMVYLLNDNIEVITTPAQVVSGVPAGA